MKIICSRPASRLFALLGVFTLTVGFHASTQAQDDLPSGKEVLQRFVKVTGGMDKYKAIKSMTAEGKVSIPAANVEGEMKIFHQYPNKVLVEANISGLGEQKRGSNGDVAWENSTLQGPRILDGSEAKQLTQEANLERIFMPEKFYSEMKCVGKETVDDDECYKVELTSKDGKKIVDFYSIDSGLKVKSNLTMEVQGSEMQIETKISDYRQVGDSIKASYKVEAVFPNGMSQVVQMEKVKYNAEIAEDKFNLPGEIKELIDN